MICDNLAGAVANLSLSRIFRNLVPGTGKAFMGGLRPSLHPGYVVQGVSNVGALQNGGPHIKTLFGRIVIESTLYLHVPAC